MSAGSHQLVVRERLFRQQLQEGGRNGFGFLARKEMSGSGDNSAVDEPAEKGAIDGPVRRRPSQPVVGSIYKDGGDVDRGAHREPALDALELRVALRVQDAMTIRMDDAVHEI